MNCTEARLLLHPYVDGELDLVRSLDVEKHIEACAGCAAENQSLLALRSALLSASLAYAVPASLRKDLLQHAPVPDSKSSSRQISWLWQWWALGATALAALLLVMRLAGTGGQDLLANEMVASHVRSLMPGHLTDVVSSDQHTVKPWFNGKLDFAPSVNDFAAEGFPLVGGRLDYLHGREVAALIYQRNKHVINVFVWPADRSGASAPAIEEQRGYHIVNRDVNGLHYSLVSDLNVKELGELADLIGQK